MLDYSKTIEVYGIKVCICRTLNEYVEIYICQRGQSHCMTLVQGHSDFINFKQLLP